MDLVLAARTFAPSEIRQIEYCQLFLQAITLADICLADGLSLDRAMMFGTTTGTSSTSSWVHITQARPHNASLRLWRKACSLWSLQGKLLQPLRPWLYPANQLRQAWPAYWDYASGNLLIREKENFAWCIVTDLICHSPVIVIDWDPTDNSLPVSAQMTLRGDSWIAIPDAPPPTPVHLPS